MALYKILSGVHRCVAASKAGLADIRAQLDDGGGKLGPVTSIPLADLYSPKPAIGRWDRGRDFLDLVMLFADETSRETFDPVEVIEMSVRYDHRVDFFQVDPEFFDIVPEDIRVTARVEEDGFAVVPQDAGKAEILL